MIGALFTALPFFVFFAAIFFLFVAAQAAGQKGRLNALYCRIAQFHTAKVRRNKTPFTKLPFFTRLGEIQP
ncbi:MAG: hypothetical protein IBJ09_14485 [Bacteroidia bacterium]|nr:hypothetical protein [Bacteroidia bacterium]